MISDQEYKELKKNKETNLELLQTVKQMQFDNNNYSNQCQELQRETARKDIEVGFLAQTILGIASGTNVEEQFDFSVIKSNAFEILGQSVLEPQKAQENKKTILEAELT